MTIKVTAEDIAAGKKESLIQCPIALAIRRTTNALVEVEEAHYIECGGIAYEAVYPDVVDKFIAAFDTRLPVEPFEFKLLAKDFAAADSGFGDDW